MITVEHEACWTHEAIADIAVALGSAPAAIDEETSVPEAPGVERRVGMTLSDDDLSHVPTFGALVDLIAERS
jgi:hypothetical protein